MSGSLEDAGSASPRFVVAICTWNRCALLRQTLGGLTELQIPQDIEWELLVVNNNCTDATDEVVDEFIRALPVRLVHEPVAGLSNARNRAVAECHGEYLAFLDDDVLVDSQWLNALLDATQRFPGAATFGGPVAPWFPVQPDPELFAAFPAIRNGFCGIDHHLPLGSLPPRCRLTGANMAFSSRAIRGLTFDPALGVNQSSLGGGEETAFISALRGRGGEVVWVPDMKVRHYVDPARMELGYLIRLSRDRGRSGIREKGIPVGRRVAGVPGRLWLQLLQSGFKAVAMFCAGYRIRAAGHFAKFESHRAKISECWRVGQHPR